MNNANATPAKMNVSMCDTRSPLNRAVIVLKIFMKPLSTLFHFLGQRLKITELRASSRVISVKLYLSCHFSDCGTPKETMTGKWSDGNRFSIRLSSMICVSTGTTGFTNT